MSMQTDRENLENIQDISSTSHEQDMMPASVDTEQQLLVTGLVAWDDN